MKKIVILFSFLILSLVSFGQNVRIKNEVFDVLYSQSLEQPLIIKYRSTNRPTNVNRGAMDFYKEPTIVSIHIYATLSCIIEHFLSIKYF